MEAVYTIAGTNLVSLSGTVPNVAIGKQIKYSFQCPLSQNFEPQERHGLQLYLSHFYIVLMIFSEKIRQKASL